MVKDSHAHAVMAALEGRRSVAVPPLDAGLRASWMRSVVDHGLDPDRIPDPDVLTHAELQERRERIDEMGQVSSAEIDRLYLNLSDHAQVVMLSDAQGTVMNFRSSSTVIDTCTSLRVLPGSIWSEEKQGTTGVGLCLRERKPLSIVMGEHFASRLAGLSCTVAPVFGAQGHLLGVLNVTAMRSTDHALQGIIRQMVASSARRIENVLFDRRHARVRILRLSRHDDFCDTATEARLAIDERGCIIDGTPLASQLLGCAGHDDVSRSLLGRRLTSVIDVGDIDRLLHEVAPLRDRQGGRFHARLMEPVRRWSAKRMASEPLPSRTPRAPVAAQDRADDGQSPSLQDLVGLDETVRERLRIAQRLHARSLPLLLQGESGSGKTQLARTLHQAGPHRSGHFVTVNCAALPPDLIESELFGHRAGAFTGASRQGSPGRLLGAHGGTLFLDEIGDMPLSLQGRLLQVLSEGEFVPVGATEPVKVRFALISATLHDLKSLVQAGQFREDLYYRLSGATLTLPALRDRTDLEALIDSTFTQAAADAGVECRPLSMAALDVLTRHHWPGNMRELQHVAKFMVALNEASVIGTESLPASLLEFTPDRQSSPMKAKPAAARQVSDGTSLLALMEQTGWNVSAAALRLGVSRATLHRRLNQFSMHRPDRSH